MADPAPPTFGPVRGSRPPTPPPPPGKRSRRPPAPSLLAVALFAVAALGAMGWFAASLVPQPHGGLLRAPIARSLAGVCVTNPSLCPSRVPSP